VATLCCAVAMCVMPPPALRYVPPARSRPALRAIVEAATRKFVWGEGIDLDAVVMELREGCTGADVAGVASAAWMAAARRTVARSGECSQHSGNVVVVEQQDMIAAAASAVPSLSAEDLERFDRLHSSFSVGGGVK
jgi:SpoVK/Ycf46/Vps4 family AAA+-type ATPase